MCEMCFALEREILALRERLALYETPTVVDQERASTGEIAQTIAKKYGLTLAGIKADNRLRNVTRARHEAMWHMRCYGRKTLFQISRFFGLDHSTVSYGIKMHKQRLERQKNV